MGLAAFIEHYGLVRVVTAAAIIKFTKFRLVCWRASSVNGQVSTMCEERTRRHEPRGSGGSDETRVPLTGSCVRCHVPVCIWHDDNPHVVCLDGCGCKLHMNCLVVAATEQHGLALPRCPQVQLTWDGVDMLLNSVDSVWDAARRFIGWDAISLDGFRCPHCGSCSETWTEVTAATVTTASPASMASALEEGLPLSCGALRQALAGLRCQPLPAHWQKAVQSDEAFESQLRKTGDRVRGELAELLRRPAAQPPRQGVQVQIQAKSQASIDTTSIQPPDQKNVEAYADFVFMRQKAADFI